MMKHLPYMILAILIFSCGMQENETTTSDPKKEESSDVYEYDFEDEEFMTEDGAQENTEQDELDESGVTVQFKDFELYIDTLEYWNETNLIRAENSDTALVRLGLGFGIQGRVVRIISEDNIDFTISQRYETSISIMNEGPHCDLLDWKHYYSEWRELEINGDKFRPDTYQIKEWSKFVDVDMKEIQDEVRAQCGDGWAELLSETTAVDEYPSGVSISAIYLKIEYVSAQSGIPTTKYVAFKVPMGC
jgi:hypothetical protein